MRTVQSSLLAMAAMLSLIGCRSDPLINNDGDIDEKEGQVIGAAVGAAAGAAIEGGTLATVIGAVAGGMIGGEIAENELSDEVLASDEPVTVETESGTVHVDPAGSFQRDGRLCREYNLRTDAGDTERAVACETEPGRWRLASSE
jgi:uncharacterized protein YcfJ